jgi:hypothetical protein
MDAKFPSGQIVATPGAIELLDKNGMSGSSVLTRHFQGDWGDLDEEDIEQNNFSLENKQRVLSSYVLPDSTKVWVITEWDRSVTTILLPEDY